LARKKNLTKEDIEDVSIYESLLHEKNGNNGNHFYTHNTKLKDINLKIKCLNKKQKDLRRAIEEKEIVITIGPAGTGKTYLSLLTALNIMKSNPEYSKLVLIKSLQTIKGEEVGYLPGTLWEKLEPYMYSYTGNLDKIFGFPSTTKSLINQGIIEIFPITYIRGVTMDNCIILIDEAQNIDYHTFKTIITRIGKKCKIVFLGDTEQIDRKNKDESCLHKVVKIFHNQEFADSITFTNEESVRNPIIPKLLKLLKND